MFVRRVIPPKFILSVTWRQSLIMAVWSGLIVYLRYGTGLKYVGMPFLPIGIIGTAVAFYVGFKNNSSYDRLWEARRIWGGIVNMSRNWATGVLGFVSAPADTDTATEDVHRIHRELVLRHLAWVNAVRHLLLAPRTWEHNRFFDRNDRDAILRDLDAPTLEQELGRFLDADAVREALAFRNPPMQLITTQTKRLHELHAAGLIDTYRHVELQRILAELVNEQGRAERIKNFPFPRQYGAFSSVFVFIFILLVPLGLVFEFSRVDAALAWVTIPISVLISWVFVTMELIGDYSENPFEGLMNDVPMFTMCRGIETDLRQMIGDTDLPAPVQPVDGILM
jgi:ion channel-forming bestrophin family protein